MINENVEIELRDERRLVVRRKLKLDLPPLARKGCWLFVCARLRPLALPTGSILWRSIRRIVEDMNARPICAPTRRYIY